jgi:sugar (pentulose or hexulose) kinase
VVSTELLLGIDVGTTSSKAAVVDLGGAELAHGRAPMRWRRVPTGAEADPDDFAHAAIASAADALADAPPGPVVAVGVASMAETGALLDRDGRIAAPAIAWHDSRGAEQAARLARDLGPERLAAHAGVPPTPLPSISKYRWLRDERPDQAARGVRWLNVAEYVVKRLGGEELAELSLASRTGMLDVVERRWWDEALDWAGAPQGLMPGPVPAGTPAGTLRANAALERARGAVLTVGGHDHLSAAVGAGADSEGDVLDSCGTAEAFVRAVAPLPRQRMVEAVASGVGVGCHVTPELHALLASIRSGAILAQVLALVGVNPDQRGPLEADALGAPADAGGLVLRGVATDRLDLTGIGRDASPALAYRAALEAVGAAGADLLDRMASVAGPARRLVTTGGWAEGEAASAVKRRHLGPFEQASAVFAGARGAALTAARAIGVERSALVVGREGAR